jgi:uncharacterized membrane protein YhaH (DUF805 family)
MWQTRAWTWTIAVTWSAATVVAAVAAWRRAQYLADIRHARGYADLPGDRGWEHWSAWAWVLLGVAWICLLAGQAATTRRRYDDGVPAWLGVLCLVPVVGLATWLVVRVRGRWSLPNRWLLGSWALAAALLVGQASAPLLLGGPREVASGAPAVAPSDQINPEFRAAVLADAERTPVPARGAAGVALVAILAAISIMIVPRSLSARNRDGTGAPPLSHTR